LSSVPRAASYADLPLEQVDPVIHRLIRRELARQQQNIELIASENFTPVPVLEAMGSVLTNKYAEGYPRARYYGGCEIIDEVEQVAIERAKALFGAEHANVQPHSGSTANQAIYWAALEPGDRVLSMTLAHGGHLSHGLPVNFSGRGYTFFHYGVDRRTGLLDMEEVLAQARKHRPRLIVVGASAYPRTLDFAAFRKVADEVGAELMADIAHIAGLVAGGAHPSPFPHCHWVTTTTHKTLAGPRGGVCFSRAEAADRLDKAVFPGLQGGPLEHIIAGKAVCFLLASTEEFKAKQRLTVENAKVLAEELMAGGLKLVSGGTDNHLILIDVSPLGVTGREAERLLDEIGITVNKNAIPFDTQPPNIASGIRVGTPAVTSRGFGPDEMRALGRIIVEAILTRAEPAEQARLAAEVREMAARFPVPGLPAD